MPTGTIKFFNEEKGFGFIIPDDGSEDVFVHIRSCTAGLERLLEGMRVRFDERPSLRKAGRMEAQAVALL